MPILFNKVRLYAQKHKEVLLAKIEDIIASGVFFNGHENKRLIHNLCVYLGKGLVTITTSGHDALLLALASLKLSAKDEVLFPVNAYPTAFPIVQSGAKPVPIDIDENGQINPLEVEKQINKNTKAIVIVHLYGLVGNMKKIKQIIENTDIILIEDCAQAFGTTYLGKPVGTWGDIGCFSFYPTKNIGALGDGGAIFTQNKKIHLFLTQAKSYGERFRYMSDFISGHSRMSEIQQGIINIYFNYLKTEFKKREELANYYQEAFRKNEVTKWVSFLRSSAESSPVIHLMTISVKKREFLRAFLDKKKIPTMIHYPYPIHLLPAFSFLKCKKGAFPRAEKLSKKIISLPFHSFLSTTDIDYIVLTIKEFYETNQ